MQLKFIAGALLVFLVTSMFSSQSAFAGIGLGCDFGSDCNDFNLCTDDVCIGAIPPLGVGTCLNFPNINSCNDGNVCTENDFCSGGQCLPGIPTACDDGDVCTIDSCEPALGCQTAPDPVCAEVGGVIVPLENTSLLVAGAQSFSWMIPVVLSVLGIGLFVFRKSENS